MVEQAISITEYDFRRLSKLVLDTRHRGGQVGNALRNLWQEITRAEVVAPTNIPPDVITMNSTVRLMDLDRGVTETYTLVFPAHADITQGRISILSPVGTAILGYRVGDQFEWEVPAGKRRWQVVEILYQPEAAGDYHL
jgi:regulator of nucleoside diphosphate kinase